MRNGRRLGRRLPAACAALLLGLAGAARAHDSWFTPAPGDTGAGLVSLHLNVGPHYPLAETALPAASLVRGGCIEGAGGQDRPLLARKELEKSLELRSRADSSAGVACWAELRAHEVEMAPDLVAAYFREIRPPEALVRHWTAQQARNVPWRESYRKFLRIEMPPPGADPKAIAALRKPRGLPLEIVPAGTDLLRAGQPAQFRILQDGRPLAGQWVELRNDRHPVGLWRQSDAQGLLQAQLPFAGEWLLRATVLEPPGEDAQPWRSRFVTLVVDVRG